MARLRGVAGKLQPRAPFDFRPPPPLFHFDRSNQQAAELHFCNLLRSFKTGTCNAANSTKIVEMYCLGKPNCTVPVQTNVFGDPCYGTVKHLSVQATCVPAVNTYVTTFFLSLPTPCSLQQRTSWNFDLIDPLMEDFMQATKKNSVIINFSTIPQWMFDTPTPVTYPSDPNQVDWSYEQVSKY